MDMQSTLATCKAAATSISEKLYLVQQSMKNLHTVHADYKTILSSLRFWFFAMQKCLVELCACSVIYLPMDKMLCSKTVNTHNICWGVHIHWTGANLDY